MLTFFFTFRGQNRSCLFHVARISDVFHSVKTSPTKEPTTLNLMFWIAWVRQCLATAKQTVEQLLIVEQWGCSATSISGWSVSEVLGAKGLISHTGCLDEYFTYVCIFLYIFVCFSQTLVKSPFRWLIAACCSCRKFLVVDFPHPILCCCTHGCAA